MGTYADFYVGEGPTAEWLGSVGYDGHPENFARLLRLTNESAWRKAVKKMLAKRDDASLPEHGWPWLWPTSKTSDYSYAFVEGRGVLINTQETYDERLRRHREYNRACVAAEKAGLPPPAERLPPPERLEAYPQMKPARGLPDPRRGGPRLWGNFW